MTLTSYEVEGRCGGWGSQKVIRFADTLEEAIVKGDRLAGEGLHVHIKERLHDPGWIRTRRTLTLDEARCEL